ncbi:MAG TPA: tRNA (adenosine(37)-N6)-threonylcarbamoyltransferase complex ATPase subunit type 1 TsaE [Candidatus Paceibacterota bacterium]|nr:tRNA (adenosine(37)-N6)-threonylcarbamoyltransferase complex ATPase subunit type 1 TsaE [Candidatus Paceibacterota bacterium]
MEKVLPDVAALAAEATRFASGLRPADGRATLVTLSGELGAGKTAFTKAVARALGVTDELTSPTFVIQKNYPLHDQAFKTLVHIDAYRLKSGQELNPLHFDETLKQADNLIMLEWPEMVQEILPPADVRIALVPDADGSRHLTYA